MDHPHVVLAIETSNPSSTTDPDPTTTTHPTASAAGVAMAILGPTGDPVLVDREPLAVTTRHADDLMPAIERLTRRMGGTDGPVSPTRIVRVGVSIGPGGYTSLRSAVAAAKMICIATGAACVGIPSAIVVASSLDEHRRAHPFAVALAGKKDAAFVTVFSPGDNPDARAGAIADSRLMRAPDLTSLRINTLVADRFLPEPMRDAAASNGIEIVEPTFDPIACLRLCLLREPVDPLALTPLYAREPDAVTQWRARAAARASGSPDRPS